MGSLSRMNRSERFAKEFAEDILRHHGLGSEKLKLESFGIAFVEGEEVVRFVARFLNPKTGKTLDLLGAEALFDPEESDVKDIIERVVTFTGLPEEEVRLRLKKANLIEPA